MKRTPQRLAIMEFLKENMAHPSADDVYQYVSQAFPTISVATVYNTLDTLVKEGLLKETAIDSKRKRYDPETGPHSHAFCVQCEKIIDIHKEFDIGPCGSGQIEDFDIRDYKVEFYGICHQCKQTKEVSGNDGGI